MYPTIEVDVERGQVLLGFRNYEGESQRCPMTTLEALDFAARLLGYVLSMQRRPVGKWADMTDDRFAFTE